MVLTILADGGFVLRCRATAGNMERYLEGAEAVGFLREKGVGFRYAGRARGTVEGGEQGRNKERGCLSSNCSWRPWLTLGERAVPSFLLFLQRQFAQ